MCLSTVYNGQIADDRMLMSNVQQILCQGDTVTLTDILERQITVEGRIEMADLVNGKVIIAPKS